MSANWPAKLGVPPRPPQCYLPESSLAAMIFPPCWSAGLRPAAVGGSKPVANRRSTLVAAWPRDVSALTSAHCYCIDTANIGDSGSGPAFPKISQGHLTVNRAGKVETVWRARRWSGRSRCQCCCATTRRGAPITTNAASENSCSIRGRLTRILKLE